MIGFFVVESFAGDNDSAGYKTQIKAANRMDMNIHVNLYLPPYLRRSQCNIGVGDVVFGIVDDVTGIGFAVFGEGNADYQYFIDADEIVKGGSGYCIEMQGGKEIITPKETTHCRKK